MKIENFYNHGTMIEITGNQSVTLNIDKGEVHLAEVDKPADTPLEGSPEESGHTSLHCPFTPQQIQSCGIRLQPQVTLALMHDMRHLFAQKVDWLSAYSPLLLRGWIDSNLSAFCRMVESLFGVSLDHRTLARDLKNNGTDYRKWTEADERILRRKRLATDFDTRLTAYFAQKRAQLMEDIEKEQ